MALATYQGICPRIVWQPNPVGGLSTFADNFESYANTAALLAEWPSGGWGFTPQSLVLNSTDALEGAKCAEVTLLSGHSWSGGGGLEHTYLGATPLGYYIASLRARRVTTTVGHVVVKCGGAYSAISSALPNDLLAHTLTARGRATAGGALNLQFGYYYGPPYDVTTPWTTVFDDLHIVAESDLPTVQNGLDFGFPLLGARAWTAPSPGSQALVYPSGFEDSWIEETDAFLEGRVRYIPAEDGATGYGLASGWNGASGWQAFLDFAREGNPFQFWRDKDDAASAVTVYLVEPMREPEPDAGVYRALTLRLRSADNSRFGGY